MTEVAINYKAQYLLTQLGGTVDKNNYNSNGNNDSEEKAEGPQGFMIYSPMPPSPPLKRKYTFIVKHHPTTAHIFVPEIVFIVLLYVNDCKVLGRSLRVCKLWNKQASKDYLWQQLYLKDFRLNRAATMLLSENTQTESRKWYLLYKQGASALIAIRRIKEPDNTNKFGKLLEKILPKANETYCATTPLLGDNPAVARSSVFTQVVLNRYYTNIDSISYALVKKKGYL